MDLDKLTKELLDKKANENNTIDLNAYAMGMADLKEQLALCNVSCQQEQLCECKKHSIKTNYGFEICTICGNEFND